MRGNRFVSRDAAGDGQGTLRTPLLQYNAGAAPGLWIDAVIQDAGQIVVRVLDEAGRPIPGFEPGEPVTGDGAVLPVRWKKPLAELADKPFRLEFVLRNAALFGFSFTESGAEITRAKK